MMASLFTFENVYKAWLDCRRRKRGKPAALAFEANAEEELLLLASELADRSYRPRPSFCFVARNDKYREVFAAQFRDRVVHHLLVRELEKIWEPIFIHDSYASRKGKGTHAAVSRLQTFMRRATANGTRRAWFLQLDIRSFFPSLDRKLLLDMLLSKLHDEELRWLVRVVVMHDPTDDPIVACSPDRWQKIPDSKSLFRVLPGKGLPIGNLTSQFFSNVYLNPLDQYVKHTLKARHYIRYVDDMILVHEDRHVLEEWRNAIEAFLQDWLLLKLHPVRRIIRPVTNGADFLGYIVRPSHLLVRRRTVIRCKKAIEKYSGKIVHKSIESTTLHFPPDMYDNLHQTLQSYFGLFRYGSSGNLCDAVFTRKPWIELLLERRGKRLRKRWSNHKKHINLKGQYLFYRRRFRGVIVFQVGCYYELFDRDAIYAARKFGFRQIASRSGFYARCGIHQKNLFYLLRRFTKAKRRILVVKQTGYLQGNISDRAGSFIML